MKRIIGCAAIMLATSYGALAAQGFQVLHPPAPIPRRPAGMVFPVSIGEFRRIEIARYKPDGTDESAGYNYAKPIERDRRDGLCVSVAESDGSGVSGRQGQTSPRYELPAPIPDCGGRGEEGLSQRHSDRRKRRYAGPSRTPAIPVIKRLMTCRTCGPMAARTSPAVRKPMCFAMPAENGLSNIASTIQVRSTRVPRIADFMRYLTWTFPRRISAVSASGAVGRSL